MAENPSAKSQPTEKDIEKKQKPDDTRNKLHVLAENVQKENVEEKEDIERSQRFMKSAEDIENAVVGNVKWHHPEGHKEGEAPVKPVFVMADVHSTSIRAQNSPLAFDEFADYQILSILKANGMKTFRFEGRPSDKKIAPAVLTRKNEKGEIEKIPFDELPPMNPLLFKELHERDGFSSAQIFALYAGDQVKTLGAENPESFERFRNINFEHDSAQAAFQNVDEIITNNGGQFHVTKYGYIATPNNKIVMKFDDYEKIFKEYVATAEKLKEFSRSPSAREQHVADLQDTDVLQFGGMHAQSLVKMVTDQGRSVGLVHNTMSEITLENIQRRELEDEKYFDQHLQELEMLRKELEKKE